MRYYRWTLRFGGPLIEAFYKWMSTKPARQLRDYGEVLGLASDPDAPDVRKWELKNFDDPVAYIAAFAAHMEDETIRNALTFEEWFPKPMTELDQFIFESLARSGPITEDNNVHDQLVDRVQAAMDAYAKKKQ